MTTPEEIGQTIALDHCQFPDGRRVYGPVWADKLQGAIAAAIRAEREKSPTVCTTCGWFTASHAPGCGEEAQ